MEFIVSNLAPIMFATLVLFLLLGFPVAFTLAANGILFGLVAIEFNLMQPALFQALPQRIFGIISNDTLLAVPFFTLMGLILDRPVSPPAIARPKGRRQSRESSGQKWWSPPE